MKCQTFEEHKWSSPIPVLGEEYPEIRFICMKCGEVMIKRNIESKPKRKEYLLTWKEWFEKWATKTGSTKIK